MYTASSIFLKTLADAGITHVFVNWGSDHPGMLEDLERQRDENGATAIQIVTCPNEMVALSAAQGYGQVVGKPAAVIVHVDVGTQVYHSTTKRVELWTLLSRLWLEQCTMQTTVGHLFLYMQALHPSVSKRHTKDHGTSG